MALGSEDFEGEDDNAGDDIVSVSPEVPEESRRLVL
jgi:hypothetical protein